MLGPHTHTPAPTARGWWTPTARPGGGQSGEGQHLTSDAPHNGGRHPPPETPFRHPHSEQRWPARAHAVGPVLGPHARTDRTRDTRVAEPWLPAPEDGPPGEGQRLTPDASHNGGRPPPPGTAPLHPRGTQPPRGMQAKGTVLGPHTHTPAPAACGWRTPTARPVGEQLGEGQRLTSDAPHNGGRKPPPGTPFRQPHSEQRRPARVHAVGLVLGPHARTDRTRNTRVAELWLPAPEDGRPGEGQRLTPDASHNGGRPTPPGTAPHHPRGTQPPQGMQARETVLGPHTHTLATTVCGWRTPTARPVGGQSGEAERLTTDAPHNGGRHPPWERPSATPTASDAGPQGRTLWGRCWVPRPHRPHPGHTGRGTPASRPRGRAAGRGTAPDTRRPSQRWQASPPGEGPHHPQGTQPPQGMQAKGTVLRPHNNRPAPTACGWQTPTARRVGGQLREGERLTTDAPHNGKRQAPGNALPPLPQRATPARKGARCGACAGSPRPHRPHPGHTGRGTPATRPRGRTVGGGTAPDNRRRSQRWQANPPRGRPPTTPTAHSPHRACRPRGQCWAPTPTHPRSQHVGGRPQQPAHWAGSRGRDST